MGIWDDLASGTQNWVTTFLEEIDKVLEPVYNFPDSSLDDVRNALVSFKYTMVYYFSEAMRYAEDIGSAITKYNEEVFAGLNLSIIEMGNSLTKDFTDKTNALGDEFRTTIKVTTDFVDGAIFGVNQSIGDLTDRVEKKLVETASDLAEIVFTLYSPDKLLDLVGSSLEAVW